MSRIPFISFCLVLATLSHTVAVERGGIVPIDSAANVDVFFALTSTQGQVLTDTQTTWIANAVAQDAVTVEPGTTVEWSIRAWTNARSNLGLAMFGLDVSQRRDNPAPIALWPGVAPEAVAKFDRPLGFANAGTQRGGSAFGGTIRSEESGAQNLLQIGGAQNTFGFVGPCFGASEDVCVGQDAVVLTGVGRSPRGEVLVSGAFEAPRVPGEYVLRFGSVLANVIDSVNADGSASVRPANVETTQGLRFVVGGAQ